MNRLWTLAAMSGATFALFVGSLAVTSRPAVAQGRTPQDVRVVNTTAQAVPVDVQGTPNVAVSSLPAVQVDQLPAVQLDGTPSVNVANDVAVSSLPAVQVDQLPAVQIDGTPSFTVANTDPIPVTFESSPAREPIDRIHTLTFPPGQIGGGDNVYTVPAGRLLVVEQFFVRATIDTGQFSQATLDRINGPAAQFPILMERQGADFNGKERFVGSIQGPLFFPAGTTLQGNYLRTGTGETVMVWSFSGYLETAP